MDLSQVEMYLQKPEKVIITDIEAPVQIMGMQIAALSPEDINAEVERVLQPTEFAGELPADLDSWSQDALKAHIVSLTKKAGINQLAMATLVKSIMKELNSSSDQSQHLIQYQSSIIKAMRQEVSALDAVTKHLMQYQSSVIEALRQQQEQMDAPRSQTVLNGINEKEIEYQRNLVLKLEEEKLQLMSNISNLSERLTKCKCSVTLPVITENKAEAKNKPKAEVLKRTEKLEGFDTLYIPD